jgi:methyl-accepting chemotaxis protein
MKLKDLRIGTRLWLAVGLFIAALVALAGFASLRASQAQDIAEKTLSLAETKIRLATRWSQMTEAAVGSSQVSTISADPVATKMLNDSTAKAIEKITAVQKQLAELPQSDDEKALTAKIAELRKVVLASSTKVKELKAAGDLEGARAESGKTFVPATVPYLQALADFVTLQENGARAAQERAVADRRLTLTIAIVVGALIIAGMLVGTFLLVRSIRQPLAEAMRLADAIAAGDLSPKPLQTRGDELGDLSRALVAMRESLGRMVGQVRTAADSIGTASSEIATGNQDLSQRTEQTASNLQQAASSMEQLTGTVKQSADSARQANQLAASAAEVAARGGNVVSQVVTTMDEINASSKKISDIIGVIDGIAFQTNILALNAAVEAARAGEQGRGFAVVASEVRSLAQRSAQAAKEIKGLIGASVEKVEGGSRLVADAGATMTEIVGSVQRVSDIIGEITAAASEQSDGIGQINSAVVQLDQMTQQNAALVEESAAAAESLKQQAGTLAKAVGTFRLGNEHTAATVHHAPAPAAAPIKPAPSFKPTAHAAKPKLAAPVAKPAPAKAPVTLALRAQAPASVAARPSAPAVATTAHNDDWETF